MKLDGITRSYAIHFWTQRYSVPELFHKMFLLFTSTRGSIKTLLSQAITDLK